MAEVGAEKVARGGHFAADAAPTRRGIVAGLGAARFAPAVRAQAKEFPLPISSYSFATASVRAAEALGCFRRHGLSPKLINLESGSMLISALVSNSAQVTVAGPGEAIAARARGQEIVLLTSVYWGMSASMILGKQVAERTGVSPAAPAHDRLKAVDGLVIASPSAVSSYTAAFKGATEAAGAKIRFSYMSQPAMAAALETGSIQGCVSGAPIWGQPVTRGKAVLWVSGPRGDLPAENTPSCVTAFTSTRAVAEANPDLMRQVFDSYRDFSDILETAPDRVREAMGKLHPDVDATTMNLLFDTEKDAWRMRPYTVAAVQHDIAFMRASGLALPGLANLDPAALLYVPPGHG
jgi:ABC-type nitrate/sulfonate/bicarbonate transport system substrate-binding protein